MKPRRAGSRTAVRAVEKLEERLLLAARDVVGNILSAAQPFDYTYGLDVGFESSIETPEDVDLFRIDLAAGDEVTINLSALPPAPGFSRLDSRLRGFSPDGAELFSKDDENASMPETVVHIAESAGPLYVGVTGWNNSNYDPHVFNDPPFGGARESGGYALSIFVTSASGPENDDILTTAQVLAVELGGQVTRNDAIEAADDVDLFAMSLEAGTVVTVDLAAPAGQAGFNGLLRAFNSAGDEIAFAASEGDAAPRLVFAAPRAGVYYVGVSGAGNDAYMPRAPQSGIGQSTGAFTLAVHTDQGPTPTGDVIADAIPLPYTPGRLMSIAGAIDPDADVDLYRVELTAGETVTFRVDAIGLGSPLRSVLRIFDLEGVPTGDIAVAAVGADPSLEFTPDVSGTYYVGVSAAANETYDPHEAIDRFGQSGGPYILRLLVEKPGPVDEDGDLTSARPVAFQVDQPASFSDVIATGADVDLFRLDLAAGDLLVVRVDAAASTAPLASAVRLFNEQGVSQAPAGVSDNGEIRFSIPLTAAGVYYVGVSSFDNIDYDPTLEPSSEVRQGSSTGGYTIDLLVDRDNTPALAHELAFLPGPTLLIDGQVAAGQDVDLVRLIDLHEGDEITIELEPPDGSGLQARLQVFDGSGARLDQRIAAAGGEVLTLSFTAATNDDLLLAVSAFDNDFTSLENILGRAGTSIGGYRLKVRGTSLEPDGDDTLATAQTVDLALGQTVALPDSINITSDVDLFRFDLLAGEVVTIQLATPDSALDGRLRLFDAAGVQIAAAARQGADDARLTFAAQQSGLFFVGASAADNDAYDPQVVVGRAGASRGTYELRFELAEQDDLSASAPRIEFTPGTVAQRTGTINPTGDVDLHRLELAAGDRVTFDIDAASSGSALDALLRVFDATGGQLAVNDDDANLDPRLTFTAPTGGVFFVGVSAFDNLAYDLATRDGRQSNSSGEYTLNVLVERLAAPTTETEPNNAIDSAQAIALGQTANGAVSPSDPLDVYRVEVVQAGRLAVRATTSDAPANVRLSLRGASGELLANSAPGEAAIVGHVTPGVYFVTVASSTRQPTVSYQLRTDFVAATAPDAEITLPVIPGAVASADFNGDGVLDLVTTDRFGLDGQITLLLGLGDGAFRNPTQILVSKEPVAMAAVATGDFNGDGAADIAVASSRGASILLGVGDGQFLPARHFAAATSPSAMAVGDVNGDGRQDLVISDSATGEVHVLIAQPQGGFAPSLRFAVGAGPAAVVLGDFDDNGRLDLAVANRESNSVTVLMGVGDGTFDARLDIAVGAAPSAIVAADFDGDGVLDLATAMAASGDVSLLVGRGDGRFVPEQRISAGTKRLVSAAGDFQSALVAADFNGDGRPELVVSNSFDPEIGVLANLGDGRFSRPRRARVGEAPESIVIGDFDRDDRLDIVTANADFLNPSLSVRLGRGTADLQATFRIEVGLEPRGLSVGDVNSDGRLDLVTANETSDDLSVLLGQGDGAFRGELRVDVDATPAPASGVNFDFPTATVIADFNGDGRPDIAAAVACADASLCTDRVSVRLGLGDGTYQPAREFVVGRFPRGIITADFNGDGHIDLATANFFDNTVSVLLGRGDGLFVAAQHFDVGAAPAALAAADLDGDGVMDIATVDLEDGQVSVLLGRAQGGFAPARSFATGAASDAIVAGDFNRDGRVDLATAGAADNAVSILLAQPNGDFAAPSSHAVGENPVSLVAGDFNGDGRIDLATANGGSRDVSVLLADEEGSFAAERRFGVALSPTALVAADINGDGRLDLATSNSLGADVSILLGVGDGGFLDPPSFRSELFRATPLVGDFDGDGTLDSLVIGQAGDLLLRWGRTGRTGVYEAPVIINAARPALAVTVFTVGTTTQFAAIERAGDAVSLYAVQPGRVVQRTGGLATGSLPTRIVAGDINGDGRADLVTLNTGSNDVSTYLARATGGFAAQPRTAVRPGATEIALADADGRDGADLLVSNQRSGDVDVLTNNGSGQFTASARFRTGAGALRIEASAASTLDARARDATGATAFADFNGDGFVDMIVANPGSNTLSLLLGQGGDGFVRRLTVPTGDRPGQVVARDFNADGAIDVAVLNLGDASIQLLLGDGQGGLPTVRRFDAGNRPTGLEARDADADGRIDLLIGNEFGDLMTLLGNGDGSFQPFVRAGRNVPLAVADLDGDGRDDWIVANETLDAISVQQAGSQTVNDGRIDPMNAIELFDAERAEGVLAPEAVEVADLNGDGLPDMIVANSGGNELLVYLGMGGGEFASARRFHAGTNPSGITVADVNEDGRPDVVVSNEGSNDVSVLLGDDDQLLRPGPRLNVGAGPVATAVGDFNDDGVQDLAVANSRDDNAMILLGLGGGFFNDQSPMILPTGASPRNVIVGDFDGDRRPDLATTNFQSDNLTLYSNFLALGQSVRRDIATGGRGPLASTAADYNRDGLLDLFVANNASGSVSLLLGGVGGLSLSTLVQTDLTNPTALRLADFGDAEGLRLLVTDEGDELVRVFKREAFLLDAEPGQEQEPGETAPRGLLLADFGGVLSGPLAGVRVLVTALASLVPGLFTGQETSDLGFDDDGSDEGVTSIERFLGEVFERLWTVVDVGQDIADSLLKAVNEQFDADLSAEDLARELLAWYLYGAAETDISAWAHSLVEAAAGKTADAVDELMANDAKNEAVDEVIKELSSSDARAPVTPVTAIDETSIDLAAPTQDDASTAPVSPAAATRTTNESSEPAPPARTGNSETSSWLKWTAAAVLTGACGGIAGLYARKVWRGGKRRAMV